MTKSHNYRRKICLYLFTSAFVAEGEDEEGDTSLTETTGTNAGGNCEGEYAYFRKEIASFFMATRSSKVERFCRK